jgi:hypothetical protein
MWPVHRADNLNTILCIVMKSGNLNFLEPSGPLPASCTMDTRSFPGVKSGRGVMLTPHPLLVLWSRKGRAIPLLPLWAVRPVQSLSACTRVHLTSPFYLYYEKHYTYTYTYTYTPQGIINSFFVFSNQVVSMVSIVFYRINVNSMVSIVF